MRTFLEILWFYPYFINISTFFRNMSFLTTETAHECSQWTFSCLLGEEKEIQIP